MLEIEEGAMELVERSRIERVQSLRAVNGEDGHARVALDEQIVKGHRASRIDA